ncbi:MULTISPECIES: MarR family winged helix-turn-helix transcriptional regulator [Rathayibacter]|uniref:MarR family transcriptional regulator n=1 Tax=Rathayibacter festucae DSM 15932 TaxID=1328866 RepID=A0A3T0T2S4_9MICO|nr:MULTISPECIES: MarR family transcriptional regulator [Rathayibacter]AZZ52926.1 MarR family transcriptional regulator [Rathayibacter festucae DSM 15932]MCJ1701502.1 MarR family transcriptional regulator [Rathayibacter festucae]ROQ60654.1 DNA-binding MarR family transcriptional regulator [Rathayibacter sp. PhB152]TDX77502.1 DNA-binding MarR family transcriptional regulator [Rathayibacter sp. PhB151]
MDPENTPPADGGEQPAGAALRQALRQLETAQRHLRAAVALDAGIGISELSALEALAESPGLTPKWLGLELSLTTGAVTALLDRLAKAGHLDRVSNPQDRRSVLLQLTDSGTALLAAVDERYGAVSVEVLRASPRLGEEEVVEDLARAAAVITAHTIG